MLHLRLLVARRIGGLESITSGVFVMIIVFVAIGLYCIYSYVCELRNSDPDYVLSEEIKKNPIIAEVKKDIDTYGEIRCQVNIPRVKLVCAILRIYPQITMTDACELVNKYYHKPELFI